jgi:glycine C-acetyltransferase
VFNQRCNSTTANAAFNGILTKQLEDMKAAGTYKTERVISSPQESKISVQGMPKKVLNFCANNYLGLSANEEIKNYAKKMLDEYGGKKML